MTERCCVVKYYGKNQALFECPRGHQFRAALMNKSPIGTIPNETILIKFARYWSKTHAGVTMRCPRCDSGDKPRTRIRGRP